MRYLIPTAVALVTFAAPAAAELDPVKLQADAQSMLDSYVQASEGTLQPAGPVVVVMDGSAALLTTPAIGMTPDPDTRIDLPPVRIRLEEQDADRLAFNVMLPREVTGVKQGPAPDTLKILIGEHEISGVYRPSIMTADRFEMRVAGLTATTADGAFSFDTLAAGQNANETAPGIWDGDAVFTIGGMRFVAADGSQLFALGRFETVSEVAKVGLDGYMQLVTRMTGGNPIAGMPKVDEAEAKAAALEFVRRLPEFFDGASGNAGFSIAGLEVAAPGAPPFSLANAAFQIGMAPDGDQYGLAMKLGVDDPAVAQGMSPVPPELMPKTLKADAGLRKLPVAQIWQTVSEPIQRNLESDTPETQDALEQTMDMLPMMALGMAAEAGSFAELKTIEFVVGPARLTAVGVGPLAPGLPEPPLHVEAMIQGLDELAEMVQALPPELGGQAMPVVLALKGMGKPEARDGAIVYSYLVEQGPQGQILVNGVDVSEIGGGGPGRQ